MVGEGGETFGKDGFCFGLTMYSLNGLGDMHRFLSFFVHDGWLVLQKYVFLYMTINIKMRVMIANSQNWIRRRNILESAQVIYFN